VAPTQAGTARPWCTVVKCTTALTLTSLDEGRQRGYPAAHPQLLTRAPRFNAHTQAGAARPWCTLTTQCTTALAVPTRDLGTLSGSTSTSGRPHHQGPSLACTHPGRHPETVVLSRQVVHHRPAVTTSGRLHPSEGTPTDGRPFPPRAVRTLA
jgi:hypothetical protein